MTNPRKSLPMQLNNLYLNLNKENEPEVEFSQSVAFELQISLEGMKLTTQIEKNTCKIHPVSFVGCYNCFTGTVFAYTCSTDFGESLAHVSCGNVEFSTTCNASGVHQRTALNFNKSHIKRSCEVACPAGNSKFELEGILVFVSKPNLANTSNFITGHQIEDSFDISDIGHWLSSSWKNILLFVLFLIVGFVLMMIFIPVVINLLGYGLQYIVHKAKQKLA